MSVHPSLHMKQLGSHWKDFDEMWYLRFFHKPLETVETALQAVKNNGYFT
jgi:hypothetical protein